jgi:hypothetical protein
VNKHKITQHGQRRLVLIVYMCFPSWVILCLFTPSIDCVYALPVLSYYIYTQSILGVNKHKITQDLLGVNKHQITHDGQHIYTLDTRREQTQNNYMCCPSWVILCLFTPSIDYVYVLPVFLCLFTPSIDCVFVFPVLSYFVFVHAKYWLCICVARLELTQDGQHIYTINTWRELTQNNCRRATHIHNQY